MTKEKLWTKNYILVLVIVALAAFTHNAFTTIFPLYVLDIGGSNSDTGFMMALLTLAGMVTRLFAGQLIDRWGRKKTFVLGSVLFTLNTLAYCFVTDMAGIYVLRFFNGVTQGIYFSPPATIIADSTPKSRMVDAMSYFGIASSLAIAVAPAVSAIVYEAVGATAFFVIAAAFAAASSLFCFFLKELYRPQKAEKQARRSARELAAGTFEITALIPALTSFFLMFGSSAISNFLLPCGAERSIANISLYFTVNSVVVIILRLFMSKISQRFSAKSLVCAGLVLAAAGTGLIAIANSLTVILVASVLVAIGTTFVTQLIQVEILSGTPEHRRGVANATLAIFQDVGTGAGATVWGNLTQLGYGFVYALSALITLLGLAPQAKKSKS